MEPRPKVAADTPSRDVVDDSPTGVAMPELVKLCAVDSVLYSHSFFPKTCRQPDPLYVRDLWTPLEDPRARLVNIIAARDGIKTTLLRLFASKRIAYGISRTILCVGASERDAIRSVVWLRNNVERNKLWAGTFGLSPGGKWDETQIEINHATLSKPGIPHTIWVLAAGVSGSLRGINFDDYRPDLIILDDPQTDETAATEEQREKLSDLVMGAVRNSLTPASEEPNAKLAMAITPQHRDDISQRALKDPEWISRVYPCWTRDTLDLDVDQQKSSWPARFPDSVLRGEKRAAVRRNKYSIFAREKECRVISSERAHFRNTWLQVRDAGAAPRGCFAVLGIDPVPPPSERQTAKGLAGKDFEAHYVWGRHDGNYHLLDCARSRGHQPSWTVATAFSLARKWRVARIVVDAVAYQRTLKWILEREMQKTGVFYQVIPVADGMKKFARITSVMTGLATHGRLWIGSEHTEFARQFEEYGPLYTGVDDDLDASALALQDIANPYLEDRSAGRLYDDSDVEAIDVDFSVMAP